MTDRRGFTIVEVLVAIIILTVGLLGLVTAAATVTRMITQGRWYTEASAYANERFEILRSESCGDVSDGSASRGSFTLSWTVDSVSNGRGQTITLTVTSPTSTGTRTDTFNTTRVCP